MPYKIFYASVIGLFYMIGKIAGGKLVVFSVMGYAFTAYALLFAGFISAVTYGFIFFYSAFHIISPLS
jgi:hypothetical protein